MNKAVHQDHSESRLLNQNPSLLIVTGSTTATLMSPWFASMQVQFDITFARTETEVVTALKNVAVDAVLIHEDPADGATSSVLSAVKLAGFERQTPVFALTNSLDTPFSVDAAQVRGIKVLFAEEEHPQAVCEQLAIQIRNFKVRMEMQDLGIAEFGRQEPHIRQADDSIGREDHAHAVLTPLAAVQEFISIVMDGLAGEISDKQGKYLAYARGGCQKIRSAVENSLDTTPAQANRGPMKKVDIRRLMQACWLQHSATVEEKSLTLACNSTLPEPEMNIDVIAVDELLSELMRHVVDYSLVGRKMEFTVEPVTASGKMLEFTLSTKHSLLAQVYDSAPSEFLNPRFSSQRTEGRNQITMTLDNGLLYRIRVPCE